MSASNAKQFPVHPGQACTSAEGKMWAVTVRRILPSDWLALMDGTPPRTLLQYQTQTVPGALIFAPPVDANPGVPQASVLARDLEIQRITDANTIKQATHQAHEAELRNDFFIALEMSLADTAPLLLDKLRDAHTLTYNTNMHDGPVAFQELWDK
jgi:hypothetical protein